LRAEQLEQDQIEKVRNRARIEETTDVQNYCWFAVHSRKDNGFKEIRKEE
jgi:hypothetical protein